MAMIRTGFMQMQWEKACKTSAEKTVMGHAMANIAKLRPDPCSESCIHAKQ